MYQIHLRTQASKLAALPARWRSARVQSQPAGSRRRAAYLHQALAALANLASLRVLPGVSPGPSAKRTDPCDPRNW